MKIHELLYDIREQNIVLPEFQREYVWNREQAKQLMVSLFKNYPTGGLLLWDTKNPPELKNVDTLPEKLGTVKVLLDGQQRLTTLHMLISGNIPKFYTEPEIQNDPRNLYFNLDTAEFQFYQSSRMAGDPFWRNVIDCFKDSEIDIFWIADQISEDSGEKNLIARRINDNLNQIRSILNLDFPVQIVPDGASIDEAINIFDRVNSQGTKLTDAELALTHVTGKWPKARQLMKERINLYNGDDFNFGLAFMTRALTAAVTGRALFETIHNRPKNELVDSWDKLGRVMEYLIKLLPSHGHIHSTEDLNTTNALIPVIAYLSRSGGTFPNQKSINHAVSWLYSALLWARYTAQTDQRLEADLSIIAKEVEPWDFLRAKIIDQRGRIDVKSSDFEGRTAQHPLYRMTFVLSKAHGAIDWFNGLPLGSKKGDVYALHSHHIFPQALLYRSGWDSDNYLHRQSVNEIANRAFLTGPSNQSISDSRPAEYFQKIEEKYPGALCKQFIPMEPKLWAVENFREFLEAWRDILSRKINELRSALLSEPEETAHRPIAELVLLGESTVLEFKSTFQWDVMKNEQNKGLRHSTLKTIAAFMNSDGGTLILGVEDNGAIFGLERDLALLDGSCDRFERLLADQMIDLLGQGVVSYVRVRFEEIEDKLVCAITVDSVREGVFLKSPRGKEFFVRFGNSTRSLDPEQTHEYLSRD